jgi:peptidoglycan hydrolase CwlO-like protein
MTHLQKSLDEQLAALDGMKLKLQNTLKNDICSIELLKRAIARAKRDIGRTRELIRRENNPHNKR